MQVSHYELTAKSRQLWDRPLPGWQQARLVERSVAFEAHTRIPLVDSFLHEHREARLYYGRLLF